MGKPEKIVYIEKKFLTGNREVQYMVLKDGFKQLTVPVPQGTYNEFKRIVKRKDLTISQVIRRFMRNYITWQNEENDERVSNRERR